jgi:hypothetical protein
MDVTPAPAAIGPEIAIKTRAGEMTAFAIVHEARMGDADAGVLRHFPEREFDGAAAFVIGR